MSGEGQNAIQKDRFEAAMAAAHFRLQRVRDRREHEWKVTLAFWGLLAATPLYIAERPPSWMLAAGLIFTVTLFAVLWVQPLIASHKADTTAMFQHYNVALDSAGLKETGAHKSLDRPWWGHFQLATTTLLAILAYFSIGEVAFRR